MLVELTYWLIAVSSLAYCAAYGGEDGRLLAAAYIFAIVLTKFAHAADRNWDHFHPYAFLVDAALFVSLLLICLRSRRYWPLWVAGLQLAVLSSHLATLLAPVFARRAYFALQSMWSIPQLVIIVFGVTLDRRERYVGN